MAKALTRSELEKLIFGGEDARRFTQDSPILPDVWIEYGLNPGKRVDLLLNPYAEEPPGKLFHAIRERLQKVEDKETEGEWLNAELAYNQSTVVAKLTFTELIQLVLPLTAWWKNYIIGDKKDGKAKFTHFLNDPKKVVKDLDRLETEPTATQMLNYPPEWIWMVKIVGTLHYVQTHSVETEIDKLSDTTCFESFSSLLSARPEVAPKHEKLLWSVAKNRLATTATWRSTLAVKADAARLLFNISCKNLNWAIIDSGIDAEHPAFRARDAKGKIVELPANGDWTDKTRVKATYDFRRMRKILSGVNETLDGDPSKVKVGRVLKALFPTAKIGDTSLEERAQMLRDALNHGYYINWDVLEPLLRVCHDKTYFAPKHEHGTHVAGILAGDWRGTETKSNYGKDVVGICPDINLYDIRVLDDEGKGDEFAILGALQFIRYLNSHKEYISVHGVNMSLSIRHDVVNYACGCTPVCEECDRLVNAGTVVVAAAGNQGYLNYMLADQTTTEGYRSISITDPGNSDAVITVGATHAFLPHSYGVSYFSSRGPTGDGRLKPDLVAPGEKIRSCVPGIKSGTKDGTSMAAPHVSGAAALLMARHSELLGRPKKIKDILCSSATDLGRERYFQGNGMVDVLRAIQSV